MVGRSGVVAKAVMRRASSALYRGELVVFSGAGISAAPPTRLPLAREMVRQASLQLAPRYANSLATTVVRPEVFFSYFFREDPKKTIACIRSLLRSKSYNENHSLVALALAQGGSAITANFDELIEAAYERQHGRHCRVVVDTEPGPGPVLFKIHGSIHKPASICLTLEDVALGLNQTRAKTLERLVSQKTVLVVGYSGNDQLDILPVLRSAPYRELIWITHVQASRPHVRKPVPKSPPASLPRLTHVLGDTCEVAREIALQRLGAFVAKGRRLNTTGSFRLAGRLALRACVNVLMHENRYSEVLRLLPRKVAEADRYLRITRFEAAGSLKRRGPAWVRERDQLLRLLPSVDASSDPGLFAKLAKYAYRADHLTVLKEAVVIAAQQNRGQADPRIAEAGLELAYQLVHNVRLEEASSFLAILAPYIAAGSDLVARARWHQEVAYCLTETARSIDRAKVFLRGAIAHARKAAWLSSTDGADDAFFYWQAKSNEGVALVLLGDFDRGKDSLHAARAYFSRRVSVNNTLWQDYQLAVADRRAGSSRSSLQHIDRFFRLARSSGRRFCSGLAFREKAIAAADLYGTTARSVRYNLQRSIEAFAVEDNAREAEISKILLIEAAKGSIGRTDRFYRLHRPSSATAARLLNLKSPF